jgi:hypothetical protein
MEKKDSGEDEYPCPPPLKERIAAALRKGNKESQPTCSGRGLLSLPKRSSKQSPVGENSETISKEIQKSIPDDTSSPSISEEDESSESESNDEILDDSSSTRILKVGEFFIDGKKQIWMKCMRLLEFFYLLEFIVQSIHQLRNYGVKGMVIQNLTKQCQGEDLSS